MNAEEVAFDKEVLQAEGIDDIQALFNVAKFAGNFEMTITGTETVNQSDSITVPDGATDALCRDEDGCDLLLELRNETSNPGQTIGIPATATCTLTVTD